MNIIFDLGGVVFNWLPNELINNFFNNEEQKELIKKALFNHSDWIDLDRGTLTKVEVINRVHSRSNFNKEVIGNILDSVPKSLTPIKETISLFKKLKDQNHELFVLSNMHLDSADYLIKNFSFWDIFTGIVFSSHINMVKPNSDIFEYIITKYNLDVTNTVFIDDTMENILEAEKFKIQTIHYINTKQLKHELGRIVNNNL